MTTVTYTLIAESKSLRLCAQAGIPAMWSSCPRASPATLTVSSQLSTFSTMGVRPVRVMIQVTLVEID